MHVPSRLCLLCYKGAQMMCSQGSSRDMCALSVKPEGNQFGVSREFPVNAFIQHFTSMGSLGAADAAHASLWMRLSHHSPNSSAPHTAQGRQGEERSLASGDFKRQVIWLVILNCDLINGPPLCTNASSQSFNRPPAIKEQKLPTSKIECLFPPFWIKYI